MLIIVQFNDDNSIRQITTCSRLQETVYYTQNMYNKYHIYRMYVGRNGKVRLSLIEEHSNG